MLAEEPRPAGGKKLVGGDGEWRVRTGDHRIIYASDDAVLLVLVVAAGHRREIYQRHRAHLCAVRVEPPTEGGMSP